MDVKRTVECKQRLSGLAEKAEVLDDGNHEIKVAEVLDIGFHDFCKLQAAIIRDYQGRIILVPEDTRCDEYNRLVSRWMLKKDMVLHLTVEGRKISNVFIGD